jgi:hypothetical protein
MATPTTPLLVPKAAQQGLIEFYRQCVGVMNQQYNLRYQMQQVDWAYQRENDWTTENVRARTANAYGDSNRIQNVTIPVVMPQVESAVTYQASVFLTGNPIFGVVASPENMDEAMQMETVIENQQIRGGWTSEFLKFFRDGFKYNLSFIDVDWCEETTPVLETDLTFGNGKQGKPKEVVWAGNHLQRWDPYNTIFDTRVQPSEHYLKGEFIGNTQLLSRVALKQFINNLPTKMVDNIKPAFESGMGNNGAVNSIDYSGFYIPPINPDSLLDKNPRASTNWLSWAGLAGGASANNIAYQDLYELTKLYVRIIPSDFNLKIPSANSPQIFKIYIVNHQIPVYVERQTNAHNWMPVFIGQPCEDGLSLQTKSLAQNALPFQQTASALMNSVLASRRRAISDRVLYDPSRVAEHHINSDSPTAKIPVRPSAYGKPISESVFPFPFRDDQASLTLQEIAQVTRMADVTNGQNPAKQGQFVKGNKTRTEYVDIMTNANGRDQVQSILLENQVMRPLKECIKINILQYQGASSLYSRDKRQMVTIDPIQLRKKVMEFKVSDGLLPSDKILDAEGFAVALQTIATSPQIGSGYNVTPLFSYLMKARGADLKPFEKSPEQVAFETATTQWQQAVVMIAKQNPDIKPEQYPPQPTPEQFGYTPAAAANGVVRQEPARVNNITNNITNTGV